MVLLRRDRLELREPMDEAAEDGRSVEMTAGGDALTAKPGSFPGVMPPERADGSAPRCAGELDEEEAWT